MEPSEVISANDLETEKMIQAKGLTAPRIKPDHVASLIVAETFTILPSGRTMICELTLANGFTVRGESSAVSIENFDEGIGRKVSREQAVDKIWGFEAYLLKQRLHERSTGDESVRDKIDRIARVCHEVNRSYCRALGDNSQPAWEDAPSWQRESARMGVDLHLSGDFGPEASHISWMKQKVDEGWVYGPIKDATLKQHPCMVPFAQLPIEQQAKDFIFRAVVHAMSE